jgi:hypothetical protein
MIGNNRPDDQSSIREELTIAYGQTVANIRQEPVQLSVVTLGSQDIANSG